MPAYPRYVEAVHRSAAAEAAQPDATPLARAIERRAAGWERLMPDRMSTSRVVAALVSFTDDYDGPYPDEAFDDEAVRACLDHLADRPGVTLPELLDAPPCRDRGSWLEAVLVLHAALRQLARGRDGRALPSCRLSLDERLWIGRGVLPFTRELSRGGDPLGDAYHYAANLAIGSLLVSGRARTAWPVPLFAVGPELMWLVREKGFGAPLFFGNHARIDRLGLRHGAGVARLRRSGAAPGRPPAHPGSHRPG